MEILYDFYMRGKCPRIILKKKQIEALKSYDWRGGNVRELQTFLERAIIDNNFDFTKRINKYKLDNSDINENMTDIKPLEEIEKEAIINALKVYDYKKKATADALKISLNTLKSKIKKYGIKLL